MNDAVWLRTSAYPCSPGHLAGKETGLRAKADGIGTFLCVNHYAANPLSFERCRRFANAIGANQLSAFAGRYR
jgi:hypothetical protein